MEFDYTRYVGSFDRKSDDKGFFLPMWRPWPFVLKWFRRDKHDGGAKWRTRVATIVCERDKDDSARSVELALEALDRGDRLTVHPLRALDAMMSGAYGYRSPDPPLYSPWPYRWADEDGDDGAFWRSANVEVVCEAVGGIDSVEWALAQARKGVKLGHSRALELAHVVFV